MQFKDVIGQAEVKQQLIDMYLQNRLGHALLFLGKEGSGALSLARAFTQYINCEKVNGKSAQGAGSLFGDAPQIEVGPHADSCGICPSSYHQTNQSINIGLNPMCLRIHTCSSN